MGTKTFLFVTLLVLYLTPSAVAQVQREWNALYDNPYQDPGTAQATPRADGIAVDAQGNVYVAGVGAHVSTHREITLIKYSPAGEVLWIARYDADTGGGSYVPGVAIDAQGHIYVAGADYDAAGSADMVLLKYNADGGLLWAARYDGGNGDFAYAMALDGSGNVYVTGQSFVNDSDVATVKFSPDGRQLWVALYDGSPAWGDLDAGRAIAIDKAGNAYVVGHLFPGGFGLYEAVILKYQPDGQLEWVDRYSTREPSDSGFHAVVLDAAERPIVTGGLVAKDFSYEDSLTIQYNARGRRVWTARHSTQYVGALGGADLAVDHDGHITIAAGRNLVQYASNGRERWATTFAGVTHHLKLDDSGDIYVSSLLIDGTYHSTLRKFDPCGNFLWEAPYSTGSELYDSIQNLALDGNNNVYVSGIVTDHVFEGDFLTVKFSQVDSDLATDRKGRHPCDRRR